MLFTPGNQFNWSADNFGSTYSDTGIGTNSPGHANANTKGANTGMLSAIAEDCYGMLIGFSGGQTAATIRRNLVDILIDPDGGTSWSVLIANLYCSYAFLGNGGYQYYFPIYLKAGTAIGSANQSLTSGTSALRVWIRVFGKPTHPELLRVGTKITTFGEVTASTSGAAITPGTNAMGSYTSQLGSSTTYDMFWWQAGLGFNDTTIGGGTSISEAYFVDVAASNDAGTTKTVVAETIAFNFSTTEGGGKAPFGARNQWEVPSGAQIFARAAGTIAPNTTPTVVAYGLGG